RDASQHSANNQKLSDRADEDLKKIDEQLKADPSNATLTAQRDQLVALKNTLSESTTASTGNNQSKADLTATLLAKTEANKNAITANNQLTETEKLTQLYAQDKSALTQVQAELKATEAALKLDPKNAALQTKPADLK
ncbi:MAG: hypothetical protein ACK56I_36870, partial [bacterium]